jgi:hypothetical protein
VSATGNHYLRPDDFKDAPAWVRSKLNQRRCLIPQDMETTAPHNIGTGEFARRGQRDWAAYCSVDGKSMVMVLSGGPSQCSGDPFGLGPVDDDTVSRDLEQGDANPEAMGKKPPHGSFWTLSVIRQTELLARLKTMNADGELRNSASHEALERDCAAGTNVVDCHNGRWRQLWYAD